MTTNKDNSRGWLVWEKHVIETLKELKEKTKNNEDEMNNLNLTLNSQFNNFKEEIRNLIFQMNRDLDSVKIKIGIICGGISIIFSGIMMLLFKIISIFIHQ